MFKYKSQTMRHLKLLICGVLLTPSILIAQLKPGDIDPNAKVLDVDQLFPFSDGVARVRKGTAFALIDSSGKFIVPFNKWDITTDSKSGMLIVKDKNGCGVIDTKGKLIVPCKYSDISYFDKDGYVSFLNAQPFFFINANGHKIIYTQPRGFLFPSFSQGSEGLFKAGTYGAKSKDGYLNRKGKVVIPAQFDEAENFSEGLAVVGNKNEFGEMKYGFIDTTGKLVIPLQFSIKPGPFTSGRAFVEPVKKDEFSYAYINRQGEIMMKIKSDPAGKPLSPLPGHSKAFINGFTGWRSNSLKDPNDCYLLDTSGNWTTLGGFLKEAGIDIKNISIWPGIGSGKHDYVVFIGKQGITGRSGIINLRTMHVLPMIFDMIGNVTDPHYDPVSRLFLVKSRHSQEKNKMIEGYINQEGVYKLIKGEGGKW